MGRQMAKDNSETHSAAYFVDPLELRREVRKRHSDNRLELLRDLLHSARNLDKTGDSTLSALISILLDLGIEQRELANLLLTSQAQISRWGDGRVPKQARLRSALVEDILKYLDDYVNDPPTADGLGGKVITLRK